MKDLGIDDLHDYQQTAAMHIIDNPEAGLLLDMGLGKTVSTLTAIQQLKDYYLDIDTVLVIAPKRVAMSVWSDEIKKWSHLRHLKYSRIIGTAKQRRIAYRNKADIYIVSRDNIAWLIGEFGGSKLPFDMVVIDESSSFKNPKSVRFKAMRKVLPSISRRVILTGTPTPNGLIDLWAQIFLLDLGKRLGKFIGRYRSEFFKPNRRNGAIIYNYKILPESEQRIMDQVSDICISMKAKDYLNLPERINNYVYVDLSPADMKKYETFERDQVLEIYGDNGDNGEISAVNAAALSNKLLQYANGALYKDVDPTVKVKGERPYYLVHDGKMQALEEIIEGANGKPILIAWTFRSDKNRIIEKFGKTHDVRSLETEKDIADWNAGKIDILVMHPASGGHGLNLQAGGNIIVWFGNNWSLELYQQLNARLDRQGQTKPTIVHHLITRGTIDEKVIKAISKKGEKQEGVLAAVKSMIKKYLK